MSDRAAAHAEIDASEILHNWLPHAPPFAGRVIEKLLEFDRLAGLYAAARSDSSRGIFDALLDQLDIRCEVAGAGLERIPAHGAVVVVSNHPFGMLDGVALGSVLSRVRPDVKMLANRMLGLAPELAERCILVDPFGGRDAVRTNLAGLRESLGWLKAGSVLGTFPAGEVSAFDPGRQSVQDGAWHPMVARLIRRSGCDALPVYFEGANSAPFHLLGMLHPRLRTARLVHEFLNKTGQAIRLRIGSLVPAKKLKTFETDEEAIAYLRWRSGLLAHCGEKRVAVAQKTVPLAPAIARDALRRELDALPPDCAMEQSGGWRVVLADARRIPLAVREAARLREMTFRAAGEGTGRAEDSDRFDSRYLHLLLWNEENGEIAGGYRLGVTPHLLAEGGVNALYTSTLFHYQPGFFRAIGPALELGRSFVRPEYQKQYAPLLLLWKGIAGWVARRPETPVLFGAVSMSNEYSEASRRLVVEYFARQAASDPLARLVRPRRAFRGKRHANFDEGILRRCLQTPEDLSGPLADLEPDGKGIPVLFRQYLKMGGRMLGFHVDASFSQTLDGLILVDMREAPRAALERYMGREGAEGFLRYHRMKRAG